MAGLSTPGDKDVRKKLWERKRQVWAQMSVHVMAVHVMGVLNAQHSPGQLERARAVGLRAQRIRHVLNQADLALVE